MRSEVQLNEYPLVSVIVPAYNAQNYIGDTLSALIRQSYTHLEIIVVDDGSVDQTVSTVGHWMVKDPRIKLFQQHHRGVAAARNLAIRHSRGCFIAPVDADDLCYPDKISKLLAALQKTSCRAGLAYSWSALIDAHGNLTGGCQVPEFEGNVYEFMLFSNFIGNASACLIRKNCLDVVGLYDTQFFSEKAQGCEDYDLFLRISEHFEFKVVREFLTGYRRSGNAMSVDYKAMEKSHTIVHMGQKHTNPWIDDIIFKWSTAYYLLYISALANNHRCYFDSLKYILVAARHDRALINNSMIWKMILNRVLRMFEHLMLSNHSSTDHAVGISRWFSAHKSSKNGPAFNLEMTSILPAKMSSLRILKEKRRMDVYSLVHPVRIQNGHFKRDRYHCGLSANGAFTSNEKERCAGCRAL